MIANARPIPIDSAVDCDHRDRSLLQIRAGVEQLALGMMIRIIGIGQKGMAGPFQGPHRVVIRVVVMVIAKTFLRIDQFSDSVMRRVVAGNGGS